MEKITKTFVDGTTVIDASFLNGLISVVNELIDKVSGAVGKVNIAFNTSTSKATLSADNATAIYYTTDGTTPTTSSNVYLSAITLESGTTLKAIATNGMNTTSVPIVTATYDADAEAIAVSTTSGTITYSKDGGTVKSYTKALDASEAAEYVIYVDGVETTSISISD